MKLKLVVLLFLVATFAQANRKPVHILATVRDEKGALTSALDKDAFVLEDGGQPREIHSFVRQSDGPLTIGFVIDTARPDRGSLEAERRAALKFIEALRPQDRAFLVRFDTQADLMQKPTASRDEMKAALNGLDIRRPEIPIRPPEIPPLDWPGSKGHLHPCCGIHRRLPLDPPPHQKSKVQGASPRGLLFALIRVHSRPIPGSNFFPQSSV